jgi:hypothetical protein
MSRNRALLGLGLFLIGGCGRGAAGDPTQTPVDPITPGMTFGPQVLAFSCTPTSGIAPLKSVCTIQGGHSAVATAVMCTFQAQGKIEELGDCTGVLTRELQLDTPGIVTAVLTVKDPTFATTTASVRIEASPRPNVAPSIDTLVGMPAEGVPPFSSTLSFTVTDPEGDATTCSIDVGGDGTLEHPSFPCGQAGQVIPVAMAGSTAVVLKAIDALGASATKTLQLTGKQANAELRISKVEWGQSVVTETLRLVEGKPALLRVYVLNDKPGLDKVNVEAEVKSSTGAPLGKLTLVGPASPPISEVAAALNQQWTVTVPAALVVAGMEVTIKADSTNTYVEADELNNVKVVKPAVGRGNVFALTQVPVVSGGLTGTPFDAQPIMTRMWPVKSVDTRLRAPYTFSGTISGFSSAGWGNLLQSLASTRQADGSNRNYYGFVKVNYQSGVAGIGYVGMEAATGRDDSPDTLAHELGHNMGRNHAPCGGAAGADANYPYAGAKIGTWGYDAANGKLMSPTTYYDLMAYCPPEWVSDYNYKAVQTFLEAQPKIIAAPEMAERVLVAGAIRSGKVTFRPLQRMFAASDEAQADGTAMIRLSSAHGRVVTVPVVIREVGDLDEQHFQAMLPDLGTLQSVELVSGGTVLAKVVATPPAAPRYELRRVDGSTLLLKWSSTRFPSASVAHFSDTGERTTLGLWLEGGELRIRTDGLTGGHFEVGMSDGLNSLRDDVRAD